MTGESFVRNVKGREDAVERIKWMLTCKSERGAGQPGRTERRAPSYGDLTCLNTSRLILDSVGISILSDIVDDIMDLLGTSCAVYEKNGDYAAGIFSSSWCRFLDQASRRRCDTPDNREAIESGRWHCHESCWNEAALRSIETKATVDVACRGGIRLFAVPIYADKETVGSISVGYGDPPCDPAKLSELATVYGLSLKDLRGQADGYDTRPPFIIELAKKRILSSARLIGEIVQRKQSEQALRRSDEKFRALFDNAKDAIFIHDLEGRILEANREACERLGYSRDEFLKMSPLDVDTPEQTMLFPERMETLQRQGHHLFETVHRRQDGSVVPVEVSVRLFESAGRHLSLAVCRDITDRKRSEVALAESEKRFSLFMENLPAGVFIKDQTGRLLFANRYLEDLFGWQECVGKTTEELVPQEVAERMIEDDRKALTEGPTVIQERITDIHGAERFFDTYKFPIEVEDSPALLAGIAVDITDRKRAEDALRESEEKFRGLVEGLNEALYRMTLPDGIYEYVSPGVKHTLGYSAEELLANPLLIKKAIHPDFHGYFKEQFENIIKREVPPTFEYKIIDSEGKERWIIQSNKGIFNEQGKVVAIEGLCRDITERKRTEEALEKRIVALTQPLDAVEGIAFEDLFNLPDLQRLQDLSAEAWGVAALITGPDGTPITQPSNFTYFCSEFIRKTDKGSRNCQTSDGMLGRHHPSGPIIQTCLSAGLWGAGASITVGGRHIGNWLIGQVRNETQSEERIMEYAREIGADEIAFREAYRKVPTMPQEKFDQIAHALFALANQLSITAYQNIQQARFIADRKQAEEALRRSELLLRQTQEITKVGGWEYDIEKNKMVWTDEVYKIHGVSPEEYDPNDILQDIAFYEDNATIENAFNRVVDFGESYDLELKFRNAHGKSLWVRTMGKAEIRGDKVVRVFGNIMDITELKQAEEALRQSAEQYRIMTGTSMDGFVIVDTTGHLLDVNEAYSRMIGYSRDELLKMSVSDIEAIATPEEILIQHQKTSAGSQRFESRHRRKDGRIIDVEVSMTTLPSDQVLVFLRDITERKQAEEALRESEARFRRVVESSPLAIGLADKDARTEYVNPKFIEKFGYTIEDMPTLADWFRLAFPDPPYRQSTIERWQKALERPAHESGAAHGIEVEVTCKDRSVRTVEVFRTHMGNKTLSVLNDITERKRMEEEHRKLEVQIREVQKLESLGVLAGGIAHDFNNLLMAILGNADLALLSLSQMSPAYQHVEEITRASQRAADLCRQMLAYSGKGRFVVSRHDISEIVREMGQILDVSVSKKAMMRYFLAEGLPPVESDATQIRQVIMNLITNASDALGDIRGVITVTTGVMECDETYLSESYLDDSLPGGTYVYLEVSDTGCGMDSETRSRIFDPFFTTRFTGRGLGLAAVLGIVRGHKGAIKVYSEAGKGTTFKILLPAAEWEPGERVKTAEQSAALQGGGTILLVDDDPDVRGVTSEMLELLGFQVLTAINGREALKVFRIHGNEITCVILDLTMPEMGGEETFRELRNLRSDVRVILSSGYNEQDVTQRFVGRGLAGFIQKPYTVSSLRSALNNALG